MLITHYCNSFISVKVNQTVIACDPWVGLTDQTSWLSYPISKNGTDILYNLKPNFIYISHLHCDHFDTNLLSKFKNKKVKIIIKKYLDQRLRTKISKLGFQNIVECEEWKKYALNKDLSISIIPQLSSNTQSFPEEISYDLDTSILIQSNRTKEVFFNNVDNPLSFKDLKKLKTFTKKNFNSKIDVACFPVGAASEYPQCFLNINRAKEKEKIIKESLQNLKKKLKILQPKVFFPAGGTYLISGKYSILNKYIAQPSAVRIKKSLKNENYGFYYIEGGGTLAQKNGNWFSKISKSTHANKNKKEIIRKYTKQNYFYSNNDKNIHSNDIDKIYLKSYDNYKKRLSNLRIKSKWKVEFYIYQNLLINTLGKIDFKNSNFFRKYTLQNKNSKNSYFGSNYTTLRCHMDFNLFYGLLKRKYIWNQTLSGSLIFYERNPNKFDPNVTFSLNYLAA